MDIPQTYSLQELFNNRKICISESNNLGVEDIFKIFVKNQNLIRETLNNYDEINEKLLIKDFVFFKRNSEFNFILISHKIKILNFIILISAIFKILAERNWINAKHYEIFLNIMKNETFYNIELQASDNLFFRNFIIDRIQSDQNLKSTNFSIFIKLTFYSFCEELQELQNDKLNDLLNKIINYEFYPQNLNLN